MIDDSLVFEPIKTVKGKKFKRHGKTSFKYVYLVSYDGSLTYRAELSKHGFSKCFPSAREAAIAIDKKLIELGLTPVNVFKKIN